MLNHFIVMGRLTAEPEVQYTEKDNIPVCHFSIACSRPKRKDSEPITDFFNCTAWRGTAEVVGRYYRKGDMMIIDGQLHNNSYLDKDGKKRTVTEVIVKEIHFTGSGKKKNDNPENLPSTPKEFEDLADIDYEDFEESFKDNYEPL